MKCHKHHIIQRLLKSVGLPTGGTKPELVKRYQKYALQSTHPPDFLKLNWKSLHNIVRFLVADEAEAFACAIPAVRQKVGPTFLSSLYRSMPIVELFNTCTWYLFSVGDYFTEGEEEFLPAQRLTKALSAAGWRKKNNGICRQAVRVVTRVGKMVLVVSSPHPYAPKH